MRSEKRVSKAWDRELIACIQAEIDELSEAFEKCNASDTLEWTQIANRISDLEDWKERIESEQKADDQTSGS